MVKASGAKAGASKAGNTQARAHLIQEYDRLIAQFGEDPFRPAAVCERSDGLSKVIDEVGLAAPKERHELLKEVTEKSLRCAELIEKALAAAEKFKRVDEKIAQAHREYEAGKEVNDDDDDEDMEDDEHDDASALLLKDLITASEEMQQANKKLANVGVVAKSTRASRDLLASTEQMLEASASMSGNAAAAINDEFRGLYVEEFTSAFGDELDQFRQEDRFESKDVTYLISCIQSGADIFTPLQKKLFVESSSTK